MCLSSEWQPGLQLGGLPGPRSSVLCNRERFITAVAEAELCCSSWLVFLLPSSKIIVSGEWTGVTGELVELCNWRVMRTALANSC